MQAFGSDLLGDQIDPHTGAISFEHTDVVIPGNSHLEVAVRRRRPQGYWFAHDVQSEFGDWTLQAPRINVISGPNAWTGARCTGTQDATLPPYQIGSQFHYNRDYSDGVVLDIPGAAPQQILWPIGGGFPGQFPTGTATAHVTTENWRFLCNVTASDGGEGFTGIAPNGDVYRFDRVIVRPYHWLGTVAGSNTLDRNRNYIAATRVTDVSGNTVDYTYDGSGRLTQISANDGRSITISYQGASLLVYQVTANGRTWTYSYAASTWDENPETSDNPAQIAQLASVLLPNGTSWTFILDGLEAQPTGGVQCHQLGANLTVTHPNGASGTFQMFNQKHRQSFNLVQAYTKYCPGTQDEHQVPGQPAPQYTAQFFKSQSVVNKTITATGSPTATWTYNYEGDWCNPVLGPCPMGPECAAGEPCRTNSTLVQEPNGRHLTYYHYWNAEFGVDSQNNILPPGNPLGGKLARLDVRDGGPSGTLLERTDYQYFLEGGYGGIGSTFARTGFVPFTMINPTRTNQAKITRYGSGGGSDWHKTDNTFDSSFDATYSWGFPTQVAETSSTAPTLTRDTDTVYAHNETKWVLGLADTVTKNGKEFDAYVYDTLGRVSQHFKFGALSKTYTYHTAAGQQGTINTITDSHSPTHVWTLSSWKRGKPQLVVRPGATGQFSRVVDNNGWVTSETDGRTLTTDFGYNSMGWLTSVTRTAPFNSSTFTYSSLASGVVQTETRGAKKTTVTHDRYLRPILVKTEATDGTATTKYEQTQYDALGRAVFQSWPMPSNGTFDGIATTYDVLSRITSVAEDVSPFATTTTEYLSGGQVRVTDPSGAVVVTTNRAFGDPNAPEPKSVVDDFGTTTTMTRDIYGNILTLAQSGTTPVAASVTRNFWYDNSLRICRHRAPEFGDEVFVYDNEDLLTQSGRGVAAATGCLASVPTAQRVTRVYDPLHRETSVAFPSGTTGVTRTYDGNSNVTQVARGTAGTWDYTYNALDKVMTETLVIDGRTYIIGHGYTFNGDPTTRSNSHSGTNFTLDANAYGEPRSIKNAGVNYVTNGAYHPNGLPAAADYLNGHLLTQSLTNRQKPNVLKTAKVGGANAVWLTHNYEVRGKLSSITDSDGAGDDEGRSFAYDGNGRLLTANGSWGSGSYVYDALGNMRNRTEGTNSVSVINYDATNRVSTATIFGVNRTFAYDSRGNTTDDGRYTFGYDFANQPVSRSGAVSATFAYDGNLKRVKEVRGGKTIYTVYSRLTGGLVYRDEATDNIKTDYVSAAGAALRLKKTGAGPFVPEYTHFDGQGSAVAATDAAGTVTWRESYRPFGRTRLDPPANSNNTGYTGHLEDEATGLVYMQARYYDASIGRFHSTDPVGYQDQLNLYAYVANDPVNRFDPTGTTTCSKSTGSNLCNASRTAADKASKELKALARDLGRLQATIKSGGELTDSQQELKEDFEATGREATVQNLKSVQNAASRASTALSLGSRTVIARHSCDGGAACVVGRYFGIGGKIGVNEALLESNSIERTLTGSWKRSPEGVARIMGHEGLHLGGLGGGTLRRELATDSVACMAFPDACEVNPYGGVRQ